MKITLLGTGAPLAIDRAATGILVTDDGAPPLLIDTCGGMELARQLARVGMPLADIRNVILTHRHMDHIGGMAALGLATQPLDVHGNTDAIAGAQALMAAAFPEWPFAPTVAWHPVEAGETRRIGGFDVTFFEMVHRVPTFGVRVTRGGRAFAFSADSEVCDALVDCARDADLFLCDAICAETDGEAAVERARMTRHPLAREAGEVARRANAKRLLCTHIGRFGSPVAIAAEASAAFGKPVTVPSDGDVFEI